MRVDCALVYALSVALLGCSRTRAEATRDVHIVNAAPLRTDPADERVITVQVVNLLAVGWADAPTVSIDEAPPDTSGTLYIPAGRSTDPRIAACGTGRGPAVGDRFRLTVRRGDPDAPGRGGPYRLRIAIREGAIRKSWDVTACENIGAAR